MKTIIVLASLLVSFSASAASHYGTLSFSGGEYHCSFENNGSAKNMKWVVFALERRAGKERDVQFQQAVNATVGAGETITVDSGIGGNFAGWYCKFLSR
ncbi:hypothetical protein [Bdellovibrio sp. HCB337]|uniref:hypothetical protein n=1 Tax=Bdellovibrio sp. HCB337 TaxID=3394358 RepID=UPI0039A43238